MAWNWSLNHCNKIGCGGLITVNEGVITSPNYPDMYDNHDDCSWLIQVDPNHRIEFEFTDFAVEPHSNCSYDYVAIYNGDTEAAPNLLTHCGRNLPPINPVYSTANKMFIRLKADGSSTAKGFKANFKRVRGFVLRDLQFLIPRILWLQLHFSGLWSYDYHIRKRRHFFSEFS